MGLRTVYLLCGPSLAGKTTLRRAMVGAFGLAEVSFDELNAARGLPFGAPGVPVEEGWARTVELALTAVAGELERGRSVVVDDTFCFRWLRDRFRAAAAAHGAECWILHLAPTSGTLRERRRLLEETGAREVLPAAALERHLAEFEPPAHDEPSRSFGTPEEALAWLHHQA